MTVGLVQRTKKNLAEIALGQALGVLGNNPDKNAKYFIKAINSGSCAFHIGLNDGGDDEGGDKLLVLGAV